MTSNWLQMIYEELKKYHDILDQINSLINEIDTLLDSLDPVIRDIDDIINAIKIDTGNIANDTSNISNKTDLIEDHTNDLLTSVNTMKQNDIDHYLAEETVLDAIKTLAQNISNYTSVIKDKTTLIQSDVYGIKHDTGIILNSNQAIATATGQCPALLNDIATNTLNTDDRVTLISADTTEIIALLRQIRDEIHLHGT